MEHKWLLLVHLIIEMFRKTTPDIIKAASKYLNPNFTGHIIKSKEKDTNDVPNYMKSSNFQCCL